VVASIEARTASTRLPRKVLTPIQGKPLLELLLERVRAARSIDQVVVATTDAPEDEAIVDVARRAGVAWFRGSMDDVMGRVLGAVRSVGGEIVVGLTGDNPLVDPRLIDDVVAFRASQAFDYATTTHMHHTRKWDAERTFPVGVSVQAFPVEVLARVEAETPDLADREHLSFRIYDQPERFRLGAFAAEGAYAAWRHPELRLTVDTPADLALMTRIFDALYPGDPLFSTEAAIRMVAADPALRAVNEHVEQRIAYRERETRVG
jgi:spore coat polysaccharide biosynthesis protein SpsF